MVLKHSYEGCGTVANQLGPIAVESCTQQEIDEVINQLRYHTPHECLSKQVKYDYLRIIRYCVRQRWVQQTWGFSFIVTPKYRLDHHGEKSVRRLRSGKIY